MDKSGAEYSKKHATVLNNLLNTIRLVGISECNISYEKLLDAILINAEKYNKKVDLYSWDISKNANIVKIDILENNKHIINKIDGLFNLDLKKYLA